MSSPKRKPEEEDVKAEDDARPHKRALEAHESKLKHMEMQLLDLSQQVRHHRSQTKALQQAALYEEVLILRDATPVTDHPLERLMVVARAVYAYLTSNVVGMLDVTCEVGFSKTDSRDATIAINYTASPAVRCRRTIHADGSLFAAGLLGGNLLSTHPSEWQRWF